MAKLRITLQDERLGERVKQRAADTEMSIVDMVESLLSIALDKVDVQDEATPPRKLDETTLRCLEAIKGVGARLEAAEPTYGLLSFGDESHAKDNAAVRTLSLSVMALPARSKL